MSIREPLTRARADALRLVSARSLDPAELVRVFNLGFSDYLVPMQMDEAALADHIANNDIDLECSRVAVDVEPVGFALVARRGTEAWIGGMGTSPAYRRIGLGARTLTAAIEAAAAVGVAAVWLEVLEENAPAIGLYERLGFSACVISRSGHWRPAAGGSRSIRWSTAGSTSTPPTPGSPAIAPAASRGSAPTRRSSACASAAPRSPVSRCGEAR